jgi:hypothetical protein
LPLKLNGGAALHLLPREHEHSKLEDMAGRTDARSEPAPATFNPFADLKAKLEAKKRT